VANVTAELHKSLLAALNTACSVPVYDAVPSSATYPYVEMDSQFNQDAGFIDSSDIKERFVYLSVWSESRGQKPVMDILTEIESIHMQPLATAVGTVVFVRVIRTETSRDADGLSYMGSATLRVITQT
jgi:hypothetical protein